MSNGKRVIVFIDHSNVIHLLSDMRKIDPLWVKWYNPRELALKLIGKRELTGIYFYCAPPPPYLLQEGNKGETQYWKQISYYEAIKKLPNLILKYGRLTGSKGDMHEKNLDTQLTADMISLATQNQYDIAILVSNDGDYVSAAETVKNFGRKIEKEKFLHRTALHCK